MFVILCDVGLILFKKYGDFEPILFVPVADALVIKNPKQVKEQKPNMFKVLRYCDPDLLLIDGLGVSVLH